MLMIVYANDLLKRKRHDLELGNLEVKDVSNHFFKHRIIEQSHEADHVIFWWKRKFKVIKSRTEEQGEVFSIDAFNGWMHIITKHIDV